MSQATLSPEPARERLARDLAAWAAMAGVRPSAGLFWRLLLLEPGFQLVCAIRLREAVRRWPGLGGPLARLLWLRATQRTGCHISLDAVLGGGLYLPHPTGVVIGAGVRVGRDVWIYQNVTLGRTDPRQPSAPEIGDGARVFAGAVVLGDVRVGAGAVIGANAVVRIHVPAGCAAVGVPARIVAPRG